MQQIKFGKVQEHDIIIDKNITVKVNNMIIFPHAYDGFHLWEAGIALTRYLHYFQKENFKNKRILELGTGVGITGIYLVKFTEASYILMSDYKDDILENAEKNALKNVHDSVRWQMLNIDWTKHAEFQMEFDYIVGADLIYSGAPLEDLYKTVKKLLVQGGIFFLLIPSQRQAAKTFLNIVYQDKQFDVEEIVLDQPEIYQPALKDLKQSSQNYPGLKELKFFIYKLTKL